MAELYKMPSIPAFITSPPNTWQVEGTSKTIGQFRQSGCSKTAPNSPAVLTNRNGKRSLCAFWIRDLDNLKSLVRFTKADRLLRSRISKVDSSLPLMDTAVIESGLASAISSGDPLPFLELERLGLLSDGAS